ncbi:hypothetical protein AB7M49_005809 [Bradyrhizobium elkanii]|jgi:hypothetical protein|nr:hypothetical protein [Bradyrhizobium elkanii]MCS3585305.1 hypothetical protein [Bradyrhizobium elkanii]MCS3718880.1 hypothetical protein [Bradyrhizobium elkanii]MCS4003285.1 hypothetical protein [Bradyrhizobium elkanii USDA 61]WLA89173.1 hypothetical protein QNJ96_29505 [Bradyrhizobium elkanii]
MMTMQAHGIADGGSVKHRNRHGGTPLLVAAVVAILGVLGMLIVDHGPWNKPNVQPAASANYSTTGEAARAAGAKVIPTEPKAPIEPVPPGPKPAHPANPGTPQ